MNRHIVLLYSILGLLPSPAGAQEPVWRWRPAAEIYNVTFSPTGDEIAAVRRRGEPEIVVLKIGSNTAARVDRGLSPAFSPDGLRIAYAHQKKPLTGLRILAATLEGNEIRLYERRSKAIATLATPRSGYLSEPVFSPDGRQVVYSLSDAVNGSYGGNIGIGRVSTDGSSSEVLVPPTKQFDLHDLVEKTFSGDRLIAVRARPTSPGSSLAGSYASEVIELGPPPKPLYSWMERKTSDADFLLQAVRPVAGGGLLVYDGTWRKLRAGMPAEKLPSATRREPGTPSPDGRMVVTSDELGLEFRDLASGGVLGGTLGQREAHGFAWSADSRRLAVVYPVGRNADELAVFDVAKMLAAPPASDSRLSVVQISLVMRNTRAERLGEADTTLLGVKLGRDTLADIESRFGATGRSEDDEQICYASQRDGAPVWVLFNAFGSEKADGFAVLSIAPGMRCTPSTLGGVPIETGSGIRLGTSLDTLRERLGAPTNQRGGYVAFAFEIRTAKPSGEEEVSMSALDATTVKGRVTSFRVVAH